MRPVERAHHGALGETTASRNFFGSMGAGVACGYFSHIPHNLSTLKLLQPSVTYAGHFSALVNDSLPRIPAELPKTSRWAAAAATAVLFPKGVVIRSAQIAGSFAIINGVINALQKKVAPS